jgi:hypothetical protein
VAGSTSALWPLDVQLTVKRCPQRCRVVVVHFSSPPVGWSAFEAMAQTALKASSRRIESALQNCQSADYPSTGTACLIT